MVVGCVSESADLLGGPSLEFTEWTETEKMSREHQLSGKKFFAARHAMMKRGYSTPCWTLKRMFFWMPLVETEVIFWSWIPTFIRDSGCWRWCNGVGNIYLAPPYHYIWEIWVAFIHLKSETRIHFVPLHSPFACDQTVLFFTAL